MSFAQDTGYLPNTISQLMNFVRLNVNTQFGTTYTEDTFLGTNFYKYYYALIQRLQENEVKTSEIFLRMQSYFKITNEKITRPNTTVPGIIDYLAARGFEASIKKMVDADAGKVSIAVNVDETLPTYTATKLAINTIIKDCVVAGAVTQGDQINTITIANQQSFDFKFYLPNRIPVKLKLTITLSTNNQYTISTDSVIQDKLIANIKAKYRMGLDFEPGRYFSVLDAPWGSTVKLEYSTNGGTTWLSTVYTAAFRDLFTYAKSDITVVTV